jgi:hypothetical protein
MWLKNRIISNSFILLSILFFSCEKELTPCECGRNLSKNFNEIDQGLEVKCEDYILKLSETQRKSWNKAVLNCTSEK